VHKYSSLRSTAHRAAAGAALRIVLQQVASMHAALYMHCAGSILRSIETI